MKYCPSVYGSPRRLTRVVDVGGVHLGGSNPVRLQSMLTCDTMDTEACIQQTLELVEVGCEIVRITAPTVKDAANLEHVSKGLRARGCHVPLVADIHFKPEAAMEAAKWVEKVRINPGNYADSKKFKIIEYTDDQYLQELDRIRERFTPLVQFCKEHGRAMRIGTNHGSLSDRIMNRYGDTPLGMVESALEFARIARELDYHQFVFSMKASNPKVMIAAYRLLVARLNELGDDWNYPVHLGVTEAGDGEDGRIKSAIGIGSLLGDGIGDTVRVSLTEDSIHEIPVARALVELIKPVGAPVAEAEPSYDPFSYARRPTATLQIGEARLGGEELVRVAVRQQTYDQVAHKVDRMGDYQPEFVVESSGAIAIDPRSDEEIQTLSVLADPALITVRDGLDLPVVPAYRLLAARVPGRHPILLKDTLTPATEAGDFLPNLLGAAAHIGALLCDGIGDAVLVQGESAPGQSLRLAYNILQAAGTRIFKTDYVACPSCGRTLFNLQSTTARIKAATSHLKGVKIAIMGCIVNGPGEMADADFGYVGGAPGKINLYVGKTAVKFNIPEAEAVDRLKDLIREHGRWVDAPAPAEPVHS
ncbi:MAG: 4-hydroxy-3-methylbut-2-en-1-yl diphosphate synthase [Verrucomicrobia bacterium 61-8]|nr:(E)-4-hydroxy-3-methylbut-2-enyl-diphosphate synthase [Verrucomicrobiota bacterium]OJV16314.1 MAG: 4-hydroxy-3-methylbut-2-en-1-yl diphosphate synthase [Verrucomicrobia bacterium 61-8]